MTTSKFPLSKEAVYAFNVLKNDLVNVTFGVIDDELRFTLETDASDVAISATLNKKKRPIAFSSRTLYSSEVRQSSVEKEACTIVEAIRHWSHFLQEHYFILVIDQCSMAFMCDNRRHNKIKNSKILKWRLDLAEYDYGIIYRAGKDNTAANALSRAYCASMTENALTSIHANLCHPGVTRLYHYVKVKNLPYFLAEVRETVARCTICAEIKRRFLKPLNTPLFKATQPFERLIIDFKGCLPSKTKNCYVLSVTDEFSRFPFAFACPNIWKLKQ